MRPAARATTNTNANTLLGRRYHEEIVNTGDVARLPALVAPSAVDRDGAIRVESGLDGMAAHVRGVREVVSRSPDHGRARQIARGEWG